MPRGPRLKSETGIYHVMMRGINRQNIFEDDEDRHKYLYTLKDFTGKDSFYLYGYCLMNNHIHLLMQEAEDDISTAVKRVSSSYVLWYNNKYERCGHLFQGRFKSEVVNNDNYLKIVLRYIHQNPIKAGLCKTPKDYPWSSYNQYISKASIVDKDFCLDLYSDNKNKARELFIMFTEQDNEDNCLEYENFIKLTDDEVRLILRKMGIKSIDSLKRNEKELRDELLKKLKYTNGISIRQLSRITGIPKSIIGRL